MELLLLSTSLSEDGMRISVSSLRDAFGVEFDPICHKRNFPIDPQFAVRLLPLHCITFAVTKVRWSDGMLFERLIY
jgi:hypothetical protein